MQTIGLIAGWGRFPTLFADKARSLGHRVVCVGIRGEADPELAGKVDAFYWAGVARLGRMIRCFKREGVERVVMAGKIHKMQIMHQPWRFLRLYPDWRTIRFWYNRQRSSNGDDHLLLGIIDEFAADGLRVESALDICPELLVHTGILTRRPQRPPKKRTSSSAGGWPARWAGSMSARVSPSRTAPCLQSRPSKGPTVPFSARASCVGGRFCRRQGSQAEAGHALRRADGRLQHGGVDAQAGGRVLAIESGKTILVDGEETIALANRYGLTIVALDDAREVDGADDSTVGTKRTSLSTR